MTFKDSEPDAGGNNFVQNIITKISTEREEERIQNAKKRLSEQEKLEKAMQVCAAELRPIVETFFSQNKDFIEKRLREYGERNNDISTGFIELPDGKPINVIWEYVSNNTHISSDLTAAWQKILNQVVNDYGFSVAKWLLARDDRANKRISGSKLVLEWPPYDDGTPLPFE